MTIHLNGKIINFQTAQSSSKVIRYIIWGSWIVELCRSGSSLWTVLLASLPFWLHQYRYISNICFHLPNHRRVTAISLRKEEQDCSQGAQTDMLWPFGVYCNVFAQTSLLSISTSSGLLSNHWAWFDLQYFPQLTQACTIWFLSPTLLYLAGDNPVPCPPRGVRWHSERLLKVHVQEASG